MPAISPHSVQSEVANSPEKPSSCGAGFVAQLADQPIEGGFDAACGHVTWQTLISGDQTDSNSLVLGVATFPANGVLHLHRHTPPEFYFGMSGSGVVTLDGVEYPIVAGTAVYIPADVEHGVVAGPDGLVFSYGFGEDAFSTIEYRFSA